MKELLKIIKEEFGDQILEVGELEDEIIVCFDEYEIKIKENKKVDVYRRYVYCDEDEKDTVIELQSNCDNFQKLLSKEFKETPKVIDDSCIGCTAVDEIVGYFDEKFDIHFISNFINIEK